MIGSAETPPTSVGDTVRELRDHLARVDPESVYVAVCDEWLQFLADHPGDPRVVKEIRRDLAPGGDLFEVELAQEQPRFVELRSRLWKQVRSLPQVTDSWYLPGAITTAILLLSKVA